MFGKHAVQMTMVARAKHAVAGFGSRFAAVAGIAISAKRKAKMKRTRKAWRGGSVEAAMRYAREDRDKTIEQGATLCDECNGEGVCPISGVCFQCRGAGCVLPSGGLQLPKSAGATRKR